MQVAAKLVASVHGCTQGDASFGAYHEEHVLFDNHLAIEVYAFVVSVEGHYPMLPFAFSAEALSRCSRVFERCVVGYQSVVTIASLAELDGGEVVAAFGKLGYGLDIAHLRVEGPCGDGVGCVVGHGLGQAETALERLLSVEVEGILALLDLHHDVLVALEGAAGAVLDLLEADGLAHGIVIGIDVYNLVALLCCFLMLFGFDVFLMYPRIASEECLFVDSHFGQQLHGIFLLGGLVYLHVPDGGEVSVLLSVCHGDTDIACFAFALVYHGRSLLGVLCLVSIERPISTIH